MKNLVLMVLVFCPAVVAGELRLPLTLDWGGAKPGDAIPVRGGIPLARGVLRKPKVSLLEDNREIAVQAEALAYWGDRSIKWLLVEFQAKSDSSYKLVVGRGSSVRVRNPVKITRTPNGLVVENGVLRVSIAKNGSIRGLSVDSNGNGRFEADELLSSGGGREIILDFLHLNSPAELRPMRRAGAGVLDQSTVRIDGIREAGGQLRRTVRLDGVFVHKLAGSTLPGRSEPLESRFTVWLHFFAGQPFFVVEHTFIYEVSPDHDFVHQLALRYRLKLSGRVKIRTGIDGGASILELGRGTVGLYQQNADYSELWRGDGAVVKHGGRSEGWLWLSDGRFNVSACVRWFWKLYPKSIWFNVDEGELTVNLYPPESPPLDVRRYSRNEWGCGETGCYESIPAKPDRRLEEFSRISARGISRTHEVMFHFGDQPIETTRAFEKGVIVRAPLEHYARSRALGYYTVYKKGLYESLWRKALKVTDWALFCQDYFRWYGFFDYGDIQSRYNYHRMKRWAEDWGRWGWGNNDGIGRFCHSFWMQYLATGKRRYYEAGEASSMHGVDVDIVHTSFRTPFTDDAFGMSHRHGVQHWSGTYIGLRGSSPVGYRVYYYLTGRERVRDVIFEVLKPVMRDYYGNSGGVNAADGSGTASMILYTAWEMTLDKRYLDKLIWKAHTVPPPKSAWHASLLVAFGFHEALSGCYDATGDPRAREALLRSADYVANYVPRPGGTYPFHSLTCLSEGYRIKGPSRVKPEEAVEEMGKDALKGLEKLVEARTAYGRSLKKLLDAFDKYLEHQPQVRLPRKEWPGYSIVLEVGAQHFNSLRGLPYALWAVEDMEKRR